MMRKGGVSDRKPLKIFLSRTTAVHMVRLPEDFKNRFDEKGDTFFEIAELLYIHPDRRYTQDELAEKVDKSNTTVSKHTSKMVSEDWLNRQENQTTFAWNTDAHNPASTEAIEAVKRFYLDFWQLIRKHYQTGPGVLAIIGFFFIITALALFAFYLGFLTGIGGESNIPALVYFVIAAGSFLTGIIVTFLSPLHAVVNRLISSYVPDLSE